VRTTGTLIDSYADYLYAKQRKLWRHFTSRPREAKLAEAAVFRVLQYCGVKPEVADDNGGPDFLCAQGQFMAEATAFTSQKVTGDTWLADEVAGTKAGQAFGLLTKQIATKADQKHYQFSTLRKPGVLAIASAHVGASLVLDNYAAQCLLTSEPIGLESREMTSVDFSQSAFLRQESDGGIVPYHVGLSAVLLIAITADTSYVCGALHPAATHPFKSRLLWQIPFVQLKDWPIEKHRVRCAWTMGDQPCPVPHRAICIEEQSGE